MAWLSRDLLEEFRQKKKMYVHWIRGQATWEDRDVVCLCREKICAVKAQLELKVASTVGRKVSLKAFYPTCLNQKQTRKKKKAIKNQNKTLFEHRISNPLKRSCIPLLNMFSYVIDLVLHHSIRLM